MAINDELMRVNKLVAKFCAKAIQEPLSYFSEADLQVELSSRLRLEFNGLIRTNVKRGARNNPKSLDTYKTGRVHNEYGAGQARRLDVVVFGREQIKQIDDYRLRTNGKYLTPDFGFELGTESITDVGEHLECDLAKLHDQVVKRGYVIHFYRDTAFADTGTKSREATEVSIQQRFKEHIQKCVHDDRIVVLAFVVRTAHMRKKVRGKCEFYRADSGAKWVQTDLKKVEEEIEAFLKSPRPQALLANPTMNGGK